MPFCLLPEPLRASLACVAARALCSWEPAARSHSPRASAVGCSGEKPRFSEFGERFTGDSGINRLMDDLADATRPGAPPVLMMGGGNPAQIPEVKEAIRSAMLEMLEDEEGSAPGSA